MAGKNYALGVDLGSSAVKIALIDEQKTVVYTKETTHLGKPYETLAAELHKLGKLFNYEEIKWGALTGTGGAKLAQEAGFKSFSEVIAQTEAVKNFYPQMRTIIELGGQNGKFITLNDDGTVKHFAMNTDCSAGTGSFLEEQALRLGINVADLSDLTEQAARVPRIAGRCSVFAKTDIIHLQQEGTATSDILLGLCYAVIRTFKGAVVRSKELQPPVLIHGGVAQNKGIVRAIKEIFGLKEGEYLVPELGRHVNSTGAALLALTGRNGMQLKELLAYLESKEDEGRTGAAVHLGALNQTRVVETSDLHRLQPGAGDCYLGIDVGSTSTNLVLVDQDGQVIDYRYLRTKGNPIAAVRQGMQELKEGCRDKKILGVGVTGSGRYLISDFVGGDVVKDEITAQARAAVQVDPEVDTIFEIGGQDSKFIRLEKGVVVDFEMNKVCAAGTGSFLEEQAKKLGVAIEDCAALALSSPRPLALGERCTVFMETNVGHYLAQGAPVADILAGLSYSIARNYLNRVVAGKKIGQKIFFQGGVAHNQGVLAAFQLLTGQEILVPPFFSVTGAWGAALLAREEMTGGKESSFRGWAVGRESYQVTNVACKGCANVCQVKKAALPSGKAKYYGARCEIFEQGGEKKTLAQLPPLFALREELFMRDYRPVLKPGVPTVGIPRVLFMYKMFPIFQALFHNLDFNVVISEPTDQRIIALSESFTVEETCYPVKLVTGHVLDLMEKGVDYIFLPSIATMKHPVSKTRQDYPCTFMQSVSAIIESLLGAKLKEKNIKLIKPILSFQFGRMYMMKTFIKMGLGLGKTPLAVVQGMKKGFKIKDEFEQTIEQAGREYLARQPIDEKVLVLITRPYGVVDQQLNMQIPQQLAKMGIKVIPKDALPISHHDISQLHPNMYWPFGQHILSAIQLAKESPNVYPVFLTNHGCGPDTVLTHYVAEIMGDKPYLHLEVDEHSSPVGLITRLEAFVNSLHNYRPKLSAKPVIDRVTNLTVNLPVAKELLIPNWGPHCQIFAATLKKHGYRARLLNPPGEAAIETGRTFTITKEYFSLVALLGSIFEALREEENGGLGKAVFIPSLEGTEIDGQYARLVKSVLAATDLDRVEVAAPFLEDFFGEKGPDPKAALELFKGLLATDILVALMLQTRPYSIDAGEVNRLFRDYLQQVPEAQNLKQLLEKARQEFNQLVIGKKKRPVIGIMGEPYLLYQGELNANLVERAEGLGAQIVLPFLTEILCHYLYEKQLEAKNKKEVVKYLKYRTTLATLRDAAKKVVPSGSGVTANPFNNLAKITQLSKGYLPYLSGGFGSFRIGKGQLWGKEAEVDGVMHLTSLYENTGLLVNILAEQFTREKEISWLSMGVDGKKNENDEIRLATFIQTLIKRKVGSANEESKSQAIY
jgi:predicted CoA-substrate-specific enzyme activase